MTKAEQVKVPKWPDRDPDEELLRAEAIVDSYRYGQDNGVRKPDPTLSRRRSEVAVTKDVGPRPLTVEPLRGPAVGDVHPKSPRWVTKSAAALLSSADRLIYEAIFLSELDDLARSGASTSAQVLHSLRVLVRVPSLRRALRASRNGRG